MILQEELGYALAPSPMIANAFSGALIAEAGSDEQKQRWLPGIASGEARGAAAFTPDDIVGAAAGASIIVLNQGEGARLVEPEQASLEKLDLIDTTRAYYRVTADGGDPLPGDVAPAVEKGTIALSAELVGIAQRALDMAVEYAKEREQFGRPIGSYQAVSHRLADMLWDVEEARSLLYYAAWCGDAEPESLPLAASMAKARASDAAMSVTHNALQTFGGIGFTWEHDLHFLLKRATVSSKLLGSAGLHRDRVAEEIGLTAADAGLRLGRAFSSRPQIDHDLQLSGTRRSDLVGSGHLLHQALDRSVLGVDQAGEALDAHLAGADGERAQQRRPEADPHPLIADADRELGRLGVRRRCGRSGRCRSSGRSRDRPRSSPRG